MRYLKLSAAIFVILSFLIACNRNDSQPIATTEPYPNDAAIIDPERDDYWAKDNFDLQRVGNYLEESDDPVEFERYLNDDDGINNLDLNGDGYADYVSVEEFDDRDSNSRGLSLFSRFGPDIIQEIARIFLYRDGPDYPGARFLINGNEQLYGDNYYYETNWQDRPIDLATYLFNDHDRYQSPYYYDNYPSWYEVYPIVDTPVYRTRIEQLYPQPVFVYTTAPTVVSLSQIKIKSPHEGKWMDKVHAKLAKPTKEQAEFIKNNPGRKVGKVEKSAKPGDALRGDEKPGRIDPPRSDRGDERGNPPKAERGPERGNPNKPAAPKPERPNDKPAKSDNPGKGQDKPKGGEP